MDPLYGYFFLCLLALRRLRYLCFDIFLRLFLINEPMNSSEKSMRLSFLA